jgi:hypothetical protein
MSIALSTADPEADVEPARCILEIELGGMVSVILLDGCSPEEAHYAAEVVAGSDHDLNQLTVRYTRTRCPHEAHQLRPVVPGRQVNIYDAKSRLSRLITEIENSGHGIVIARNGRPVAQLLPIGTACPVL